MEVIYFTTYYANQNKGRADSTLEIQNSEFKIIFSFRETLFRERISHANVTKKTPREKVFKSRIICAILRLVEGRGCGAYLTYVSNPRPSQTPKEPN